MHCNSGATCLQGRIISVPLYVPEQWHIRITETACCMTTERESRGKGMITALSVETGFICNVNQDSFLWDLLL